jgi:hypothetical protein
MNWHLSHRADPRAVKVADRRYDGHMNKLCAFCGARHVAKPTNIYCSKLCSNRATASKKAEAITVPPEIRFWAKVEKGEGCWQWFGSRLPDGYGHFGINKSHIVLAHVFSYGEAYGPVEPGKEVHHKCVNRSCVRPDHLEALTPKEHAAQHRKITCKRGHVLDSQNVRITKDGRRDCRLCQRARYHERKA